MAVTREQIGQVEEYRGHKIVAHLAGPDLLGYVDDVELSGFYLNTAAVSAAGQRYIDGKIKDQEKKGQSK